MVETSGPNVNYPTPWDKLGGDGLFENVDVLWTSVGVTNPSALDTAVAFASSGYYQCFADTTCMGESVETKPRLDKLLNNAPASFEGAVIRFQQGSQGIYYYICTRNNNFTNRSQKGHIRVK